MLDRDEDGYTDDLGEMDGFDEGRIVEPGTPEHDRLTRRPSDPTDITLLFEIGIKEELALPIMARAKVLGLSAKDYMRRIILAHADAEGLRAAEQDTPDAA